MWVEEGGRPTIETELQMDSRGHIGSLSVVQHDSAGEPLAWVQQIEVALGYAEGVRLVRVPLRSARTEVPEVRGWGPPLFALPNGRGLAYGRIVRSHIARAGSWRTFRRCTTH